MLFVLVITFLIGYDKGQVNLQDSLLGMRLISKYFGQRAKTLLFTALCATLVCSVRTSSFFLSFVTSKRPQAFLFSQTAHFCVH